MERLTEFWKGHNIYLADIYDEEEDTGGIGFIPLDSSKVEKIVQRLGEYEQAEEDGLLVKVAQGEWIFKNDGVYGKRRAYCSACGKRSGIGGIESNQRKPFCPNCGAKMCNVEK